MNSRKIKQVRKNFRKLYGVAISDINNDIASMGIGKRLSLAFDIIFKKKLV